MRAAYAARLEQGRVQDIPEYRSPPGAQWGAFALQGPNGAELKILAAPGGDLPGELGAWEHVSVSVKNRAPNWPEMQFVKELFWYPEDTVIQFHPPRSRYVNCHPHCLHLWRKIDFEFPLPPMLLVGPSS